MAKMKSNAISYGKPTPGPARGAGKPKSNAIAYGKPTPRPQGASGAPNVFDQAAGAYTQALGATQNALGYTPQQINLGFGYTPQQVRAQQIGNAPQVRAQQIGNAPQVRAQQIDPSGFGYDAAMARAGAAAPGVDRYMNQYTDAVVSRTQQDLERQRQMMLNDVGAQATRAGAFGGSRHGIAEAQTNEATARQMADASAQLRQQGYTTALGASQTDVANRLQAGLANQQAANAAAQFGQQASINAMQSNQQAGLQAQQANQNAWQAAQQSNQQAGLQAQQANQNATTAAAQFGQQMNYNIQQANQAAGLQGAQFGLQAANQMGNMANLGFGFGQQINQQQWNQGLAQQQLYQQVLNNAAQQYQGFAQQPYAALNVNQQALSTAAGTGAGSVTTTPSIGTRIGQGIQGAIEGWSALGPQPQQQQQPAAQRRLY